MQGRGSRNGRVRGAIEFVKQNIGRDPNEIEKTEVGAGIGYRTEVRRRLGSESVF